MVWHRSDVDIQYRVVRHGFERASSLKRMFTTICSPQTERRGEKGQLGGRQKPHGTGFHFAPLAPAQGFVTLNIHWLLGVCHLLRSSSKAFSTTISSGSHNSKHIFFPICLIFATIRQRSAPDTGFYLIASCIVIRSAWRCSLAVGH